MKTFRNLSIGDLIYSFEGYSIPDEKISSTEVKTLEMKDGNLLVNKGNSYGGGVYYLIKVADVDLDKSVLDGDSKTFYLNKEQADDILREKVVKKIIEIEASIPAYKKSQELKIEEIRVKFYELLKARKLK